MRIWNSTMGGVDLAALASRGNRRRSVGVVIPPVVRPILLTDQLRACSCSSLGYVAIDPEGPGAYPDMGVWSDAAWPAVLQDFAFEEAKVILASKVPSNRQRDAHIPTQEAAVESFTKIIRDYDTLKNSDRLTRSSVDAAIANIRNVQAGFREFIERMKRQYPAYQDRYDAGLIDVTNLGETIIAGMIEDREELPSSGGVFGDWFGGQTALPLALGAVLIWFASRRK